MQEFYKNADAKPALGGLFTAFIMLWAERMNQVVFAKLAITSAASLGEGRASLALLEACRSKVSTTNPAEREAIGMLLDMEGAHYCMAAGDLASTKAAIERHKEAVDATAAVDALVLVTYLRVTADYAKVTCDFSAYYRCALRYLAAVTAAAPAAEVMTVEEATERGHDLCIAALLGDSIYNFGELLLSPVLRHVAAAPSVAYLAEAVAAFNGGSQEAFAALLPRLSAHPTLAPHVDFIREKISLMAVVECVFRQIKRGRTLPFDEVARAAAVSPDQVEVLLMKAMSLKLIRGTIKQTEGVFVIEWVQPRVLDHQQIVEMRASVHEWRERIRATSLLINSMLPESLTAASVAI